MAEAVVCFGNRRQFYPSYSGLPNIGSVLTVVSTGEGQVSISEEVHWALRDVSEGFCRLCGVALIVHTDRACCPCGGCSYRISSNRLEMLSPCEQHPARECEHWREVWKRRTEGGP